MALNIDTLMADYNGTAMAVAGHGEWGFIPEAYKLAIPAGNPPPDAYVINTPWAWLNTAGNVVMFLKANYHRLRGAGCNEVLSLFGALFRLHIALRGTMCRLIVNRAVIEDEYAEQAHLGGNWGANENNIPNVAGHADIAKFIKRFGNTLVHMMVLVFLGRGHHWQNGYDDIYNKLKTACFIPENPGFVLPGNEYLFRLFIHAFGIKPLYDMTRQDVIDGRIAAAIEIRFRPCPPIAGASHITTLYAIINAMSHEPWWGAFEVKFRAVIEIIADEVTAIRATPTEYHVAARVFGPAARRLITANAMTAFHRLVQFALGYVDHLTNRHSLAGQRAVTAKSGGATGLADSFSRACDRFGRPGIDVADMATYLAPL